MTIPKVLTAFARRARKLLKNALRTGVHARPDVRCRKERFGSSYGGWNVATEQINKNSVVYSFGVGEDVSFDIALIERFDLTVHAFDPTPKSIEWVRRQAFPSQFRFHEVGIADVDGVISLNPPEDPTHVSHTILDRPNTKNRAVNVVAKRLSTIAAELGHPRIDLLKMDIEGAEYRVLADIENSGIRPGQILVEFHHRFPNVGIAATNEAIARLKRMGYGLFSVSESGEEFSFTLTSGV